MSRSDCVLYDVADAVATITLNRPEALNACTVELKEALIEALARAAGDGGVRAVVLTGAGRAFCVGQDLREHALSLERGDGGVESTVREHYNRIAIGIARMPKPVIAAVNGAAAGAGASFAFAADFRIMAPSASYLMAFARVGLGADSGASWTLQRLVGHARAVELLMLAEPVPAERALELGLAHSLADDVAHAARSLATRLAIGPTLAYAAIKEGLAYAAVHDLAASLENEAVLQARAGASQDHVAATNAFVAKQPVTFTGR